MATEAQQFEFQVRRWVNILLDGHRIEDSIVECKAEWPRDHRRAARQLAALANAARGTDVVWLIGLDEDGRRVVPPGDTDPAEWWAQTGKHFDQVPLDLQLHLVVPISEQGVVVALKFTTDRAPYVHLTGTGGGTEREVPWRDGTRTRSARRDEIVSLLAPLSLAPEVDLLEARADAQWRKKDSRDSESPMHFTMGAMTSLVFRPTSQGSVLLLLRDIRGEAKLVQGPNAEPFFIRELLHASFGTPAEAGSILDIGSGIEIAGPGVITLWLGADPWGEDWGPERSPQDFLPQAHHLRLDIRLQFRGADHPQTVKATLDQEPIDDRFPGRVNWRWE